jgi:hypothetical protein
MCEITGDDQVSKRRRMRFVVENASGDPAGVPSTQINAPSTPNVDHAVYPASRRVNSHITS